MSVSTPISLSSVEPCARLSSDDDTPASLHTGSRRHASLALRTRGWEAYVEGTVQPERRDCYGQQHAHDLHQRVVACVL
eukprot:9467092-Pyramimonas_sp.AAC.2